MSEWQPNPDQVLKHPHILMVFGVDDDVRAVRASMPILSFSHSRGPNAIHMPYSHNHLHLSQEPTTQVEVHGKGPGPASSADWWGLRVTHSSQLFFFSEVFHCNQEHARTTHMPTILQLAKGPDFRNSIFTWLKTKGSNAVIFVFFSKKVAAMNEIEDEAAWCVNCGQACGERGRYN